MNTNMKNPYQLLNEILSCFGNQCPSTIILGGSYSTNEFGNLTVNDKFYALSDFDLLCINESDYTIEKKFEIYQNMLNLSKSINQFNPYFHIGLKIRTPEELQHEVNSLYFKELSINGKTLIGRDFASFFDPDTVFGFSYLKSKILYNKLYNCALTRMWCNILFFPLKSLIGNENSQWNVWYSYIYSRGAMDWITFELIENNKWYPSYIERFNVWKNGVDSKKQIALMNKCLDIKLGKLHIDFKEIFSSVLSFSVYKLKYYVNKTDLPQNNFELQFIISMLQFIDYYISNKSLDLNSLKNAKNNLEQLINKNIDSNYSDLGLWHLMRCKYSDYRFSKSSTDKNDHYVYTNHFLKLGAY